MKKFLHTFLLLIALLTAVTANALTESIVPTSNIPGPAKISVATPSDYSSDTTRRYPVVYLLNGHGGDHTSWSKIINLDSLATAYNMIIVCPAGLNSWYWDSPVDSTMKMESYITADLVPWIDHNYRTIPTASQRAITGLSMGGHGAMWLALRHPDLFRNVGSTSGGVDFRPWPKSWNIADRLGDYDTHRRSWDEHTVMSLVSEIPTGYYNIIFDCGTDDFFFDVNNRLDAELTKRHIPHTYLTSPGAHNGEYWRRSIIPQLQFFATRFAADSRHN